jgi:PAS domain S-box-containing protein
MLSCALVVGSVGGSVSDVAAPSVTHLGRQLAAAEQITHIGSWAWNARTGVVTWSDELYRIYGLEPQSCPITFETFLQRLVPEDREVVQREVAAALERGSRFAYSERIVRPDESIRQLDTVGEAVRDGDGNVVGLIGTCRDVTDERAREQLLRVYADIVHNVQIGLSVWSVADAEDVGTFRLVAFNPAAERVARRPLAPYLGAALLDVLPFATGGRLQSLIASVARDGAVREVHVHGSRDPAAPTRSVALKGFPLAGGCVGIASEDVTEQILARKMQAAEAQVFEMIAEGSPLDQVLAALARCIEDQAPPTIASILLLDADGQHVRRGAAPHLPEAYCAAIDGQPIGPNAGSCGTAAYLRRLVVTSDVLTDPHWEAYRDLARAHGLRACWSMPVLATDDRVLGVFALYYRQPRTPREDELALIERASHIAGIAIERRQLEDELRALSAHIESVREEERASIAREIHDELGQMLTALKMDLAWIRRRTEAAQLSKEALIEKVQAISEMTDGIIEQVRRISAELRPGVLDDLGLQAALEWQAQQFEQRTGITCVLRSTLEGVRLERDLSTAVFRICQEALTNVARHADAKRVEIDIALDGGWLRMDISDDGKGVSFEAARSPRSLGILGMRERARRLGGAAAVSGGPSRGTRVSVRIPVASPPSPPAETAP